MSNKRYTCADCNQIYNEEHVIVIGTNVYSPSPDSYLCVACDEKRYPSREKET